MKIRKETIGRERAPLLVIDDFSDAPETLIRQAVPKHFAAGGHFFPGIRAKAPLSYQRTLTRELQGLVQDFLRARVGRPSALDVPLLAGHHTAGKADHGTADSAYGFHCTPWPRVHPLPVSRAAWRHGFLPASEHRFRVHRRIQDGKLHQDPGAGGEGAAGTRSGYINGDTPLFEQIAKEEGVFNRLLVYRRNSLHSGCIGEDFLPDPNPLSGRLSINSFIDVVP